MKTPLERLQANGAVQIDGAVQVLGGHGGNGGTGGAGGVGAAANVIGKVSGDGGQGGFSQAGNGADAAGHIQIISDSGDIVLNADVKALTGDEADCGNAGVGGAAGTATNGATAGLAGASGGQFDGSNGNILSDDMRIIALAGQINQLSGLITTTALMAKSATGINLGGPNFILNMDMDVSGAGNVFVNSNQSGTTFIDLDTDGNAITIANGDLITSTFNAAYHDIVNVSGNIDMQLFGATLEFYDGTTITAGSLNVDNDALASGNITLNTLLNIDGDMTLNSANINSLSANSGIVLNSGATLNAESGNNTIQLENGLTNTGATILVDAIFGDASLQVGDTNGDFIN